jgi:hypothetical protein
MKTRLLLILFTSSSFIGLCQPPPDSLVGIYKGLGYYKISPDTIWTITETEENVTNVDTSVCKAIFNGYFFGELEHIPKHFIPNIPTAAILLLM